MTALTGGLWGGWESGWVPLAQHGIWRATRCGATPLNQPSPDIILPLQLKMAALGGARCLKICRTALYRVFVSPLERPEAALGRGQLLSSAHVRSARSRLGVASQVRSYPGPRMGGRNNPRSTANDASEDMEREKRGIDRRFTTRKDIERSQKDRMPQDHEITDPRIMVLDNGVIEGPLSTRLVLSKLEATECLRMVKPYVPANPKAEPHPTPEEYALCEVLNKKEEYERKRELQDKKKAAAANKPKRKELEITWSIGGHDLDTKLRQMSGFLEKGWKVDLTIGVKRRGKPVDRKDMDVVVQKVRDAAEGAAAREAKPVQGEVGKTMRMYFEGRKMQG